MTSGTGDRRAAFSLLELIIVIAILIIFSGFFMLRFDDSDTEERLTRSSTEIESLALKAKKRSFAFRRDQYIVFSSEGAVLSDSAVSGDQGARSSVIGSVEFPDKVRAEIKPQGESKWQRLDEFVWTFRDSGLSDPIQLRFSLGRSYAVLNFNVLTAKAEKEVFLPMD